MYSDLEFLMKVINYQIILKCNKSRGLKQTILIKQASPITITPPWNDLPKTNKQI